jgi:predicted dehydrogenase
MNATCNIAIIGCGYWGPNLVRNFSTATGGSVVLLCDSREDRLAHLKSLYPHVGTTTNLDDVLKNPDIDAVAIATPVGTHFTLAQKTLSADKHTFIEKPMASSAEQCRELVALAEKKELALMVGHTFLYSSPVRAIKELVASGELGELLYVSSRRLNLGLFQKDINVTWDLAPHDISIILHVVGDVPSYVACQGKADIAKGLEDVTNMSLGFTNGVLAMVQSSWLDPNKTREMTFVGNRKMLVYDDLQPVEKIKIYDKRVEVPPHYDSFAEFQYSYHYGDMLCPYIREVEPLKVECQHFVDCARNGTTPLSDGRNGLQVVCVLEAATKSLRNGGGKVPLNGKDTEWFFSPSTYRHVVSPTPIEVKAATTEAAILARSERDVS